jgi:hypothetical protein
MRRYVTVRVLRAQLRSRSCIMHRYVRICVCMPRYVTVSVLRAHLRSRSCIMHRYVRIRVLRHRYVTVRVLCAQISHDSCRETEDFFIEVHKLRKSRQAVIL